MDIKTQVFCLIAVNLLLGVLLLISAHTHKFYRGYKYWAYSNLALALGWLLLTGRGRIPDFFTAVVASTLFSAVAIMHLVGLRIFLGLKPRYGHFVCLPVMAAVYCFFTYILHLESGRMFSVTGFAAIYILLLADLLRRSLTPQNRQIFLAIIAVYGANAAALLWRGGSWLFYGHPGGLFQARFTDNLYYLIQLVSDISWVVFFMAINSLWQNLELNRQNAELQEAAVMNERFLTVLAHDLRGPLGSLKSGLEACREDYSRLQEDKKLDLLALLAGKADSVYRQLESLLSWGQGGDKRSAFRPRPVNLFSVVTNVIVNLRDEKGVEIINEAEPGASVRADPDMLETVIRNLLANAVKFSRPGGEVRVLLSKTPEGALVTVADGGVGIPGKRLKDLFKPGGTESTRGTANEAGTGLGLGLCAGFIERHGGRIWAESDGEKGARFLFTLPAEPLQAGAGVSPGDSPR